MYDICGFLEVLEILTLSTQNCLLGLEDNILK